MCLPAAPADFDKDETFFVPTFSEKAPPKLVDMNDLDTSEKLTELKQKDPFMYYSLPPVHDAVMHGRSTDPSAVHETTAAASGNNGASSQGRTVVKRRSCLSFESHSTPVFEDLLRMGNVHQGSLDQDDDDEFLDMFLSFEPQEPSAKRMRHD
jgi:hypothetical protein